MAGNWNPISKQILLHYKVRKNEARNNRKKEEKMKKKNEKGNRKRQGKKMRGSDKKKGIMIFLAYCVKLVRIKIR